MKCACQLCGCEMNTLKISPSYCTHLCLTFIGKSPQRFSIYSLICYCTMMTLMSFESYAVTILGRTRFGSSYYTDGSLMSLTYFSYRRETRQREKNSGGKMVCKRDKVEDGERDAEKRQIIYRRWKLQWSKTKKWRGQMNDEMRKRWADIERIYHAMISWQFVSFYVVSATAASTHCA